MSSILHNQLNASGSRARRALATVVVGFGLASAGYIAASAVPQASGAEGHTASASVASYPADPPEMRAYEAKGYVPTACTIRGTLLVNPRTGRAVTIEL